jgi:hypothetical protein
LIPGIIFQIKSWFSGKMARREAMKLVHSGLTGEYFFVMINRQRKGEPDQEFPDTSKKK